MTNLNAPAAADLPTIHQLNRAALLAVVAASVILVTTVLPAEYGVDPTGVGNALGLTAMGLTKQAAEGSAQAPVASDALTSQIMSDGSTEVRFTLKAYQGKEVKATMNAGEEFTYRWATDGAKVEFELHGDPKGGDGQDFTSYEKGNSAGANGTFRAPFDGNHGWYWKNNTNKPVVITANAKGTFEKFAPVE